jgi:hypothetical protein
MSARFFAEEGEGGGGGAVATPAGDAGKFDIGTVFNPDGTFAEGWKDHVKDILGDSKYFDSIKDAKGLLKSTVGLSKLAGRKLLPKDDAPDEEWDGFFKSLGVPEKPEDYGLEVGGVEDKAFLDQLTKMDYIGQVQKALHAAGLPTKIAPKMATALLANMQEKYESFNTSAKEIREKLVEPSLGKVKYDDAAKLGRAGLAKVMGHTDEKPNEIMTQWLALMDLARLADHPLTVAILHQYASRMNPARPFVQAAAAGKNLNTGPGYQRQGGYARAMAPLTSRQVGLTE